MLKTKELNILNKMNYEEGKAFLETKGFREAESALDEVAKVADIYFANDDDEMIAFVTVYSKLEKAEDGSWDTEVERGYWEEIE